MTNKDGFFRRLWGEIQLNKTDDPPASKAQVAAHRALLDRRCHLAMLTGTLAYLLNTMEAWFNFVDAMPVKIQLGCSLLMCLLTAFSFTPMGRRHKLAIFNVGFFAAIIGFEANVVYEHAFRAEYAAGFPVFFSFYCVLIAISTARTAVVGVSSICLIARQNGRRQASLVPSVTN